MPSATCPGGLITTLESWFLSLRFPYSRLCRFSISGGRSSIWWIMPLSTSASMAGLAFEAFCSVWRATSMATSSPASTRATRSSSHRWVWSAWPRLGRSWRFNLSVK